MKKIIKGRYIYINTKKSQTVNICSESNERGDYDKTYRLKGRSVFEENNIEKIIDGFSNLDELETWSEDLVKDGKAVKEPSCSFNSNYDPDKDKCLEKIKNIVEEIIHNILEEFIKFPYLHRVEHSFHAHLISRLIEKFRKIPELNKLIQIGDEKTQLIHKEWPEMTAWRGTRGNFDIAILSPTQFNSMPKPNINDFLKGVIPPPIVIECGLNYNIKHLRDDLDKIIKNGSKFGYIIHFVRDGADEQKEIEKEDIFKKAKDKGYKIAYAYVDGRNIKCKHLDDEKIIPRKI